jgi:hypothetical protein
VVNCAHPVHHDFMAFMAEVYLKDRYKGLHHWTDCYVLDAAIRNFAGRMTTHSLSEDQADKGHPMAVTEMGRYIDHKKGERKDMARSPENKFRREWTREQKKHEAARV